MSNIKLALVTSGDPRRPDEVQVYEPPPVDPEKETPSVMLLIGSLLGLAGLYLRVRICSWAAAFATLSAFATIRQSQMDTKQLLASAVFSVMGIASLYLLPTGASLFGSWGGAPKKGH